MKASIDAVAKAIARFESVGNKQKDFKAFHFELSRRLKNTWPAKSTTKQVSKAWQR